MSDTGYRKPPTHGQFKKGKSGNPKGRPKGARNFHSLVEAELNSTIAVTENGKKRKKPKINVVIAQTVNKSLQGDPKATALVVGWGQQQQERDGSLTQVFEFNDRDRDVLKLLAERMAIFHKDSNDG